MENMHLPDGRVPDSEDTFVDYQESGNTYLWRETDPSTGANWRFYHESFSEQGISFMPVWINQGSIGCVVSLWTENSSNTNLRGACEFERSVTLDMGNAVL